MPRCCGAPLAFTRDHNGGSPQNLGLQIQDGNPRNKTALGPGYSLMDWIKLGATGIDLTGVDGIPRDVTMAELAKHNKENDAWIAIRGIVFNVTHYMKFHPGGIEELMKGVGKDATKIFENIHAYVNYQSILQKCIVGRLNRSTSNLDHTLALDKEASDKKEEDEAFDKFVLPSIIPDLPKNSRDESALTSSSIPNVRMNWKQTTNTIKFFYQSVINYPAANYQLTRINDSKIEITINFGYLEKDIVSHEFQLADDIKWPPQWTKNHETMEVNFILTKKTGALWKSYGTRTTEFKGKCKERLYREYEVISNTLLCKVVHLMVLRAKDYLELVPIGRHLEAKINVLGTEVSRMYTPVPPCLHPDDMAPNYTSDCICLMVKNYPEGALTPSMTALQPGQTLSLSSGLGTFTVESFDIYSTIHMLAAGTGLTAMLGIIQRALCRRNVILVNLINFNKDEDNIFYSKELERVSADKKLKVTQVLLKPNDTWTGRKGEISSELMSELIGNSVQQACIFSCGPRGFMETAKKLLLNLGWNSMQMHDFDD
ncbi:cytochrome b5 reductase 4 isoform X2 [Leptopilina boulardi]|uniref:cytochrome b5 reductase 4 isoform X2 n=1 Tax=Leptopilina boulardi TaxID=63433 RepID=UPI0021F52225|nr:cytochrome b5 reductase 4 isoform X2 [Leptopilina boulardi]XP_051162318.1 cytochrome b5 reductase 4 isoform X2 [Leptopilina boulardi]XP_051162319.1 cytochrome b5 reductase 4 isoform X2 [Leptopilina boulardi]